MNHEKEYSCKICNKLYASQSSLCNHNKKFHSNDSKHYVTNGKQTVNNSKQEVNICNQKINTCKYCNKLFSCKQSRWKHEQSCKITDNNKIVELEKKIINYDEKNTINEMKKQFSMILKEKGKIHHKTLQKINNQLTNTINNNQLTNNINNGNIINNTFVKFGDLEYQKVFNNSQIKQILNKQYHSLEESIKLTHFNEALPEYGNIFITNMKDDLAYVFDGKQFISVRKNEMLNELIDTHVKEINLSLEKNKNKINEKYVVRLEKFLDMLNDDDTQFTDQNNQRTYPSYKAYKINSIKLLIYNESDKKKLELLNTIKLKEKVDDSEDSDNSEVLEITV